MKVHQVEQRSEAWKTLRLGMFTASNAGEMMAQIKTGEAAARRDLKTRLVLERITRQSQENGFVSVDMQRGTDKEPDALAAYEAFTGNLVQPVGFVSHDTLMAGASPDGIIGDFVGGLELKCPKSATHLSYLRNRSVPKDYLHQIVHSLWITGAAWWDFASFDDRFPPSLQLFHVRVVRNTAEIDSYEIMARAFLSEVDRECDELAKLAGLVAA